MKTIHTLIFSIFISALSTTQALAWDQWSGPQQVMELYLQDEAVVVQLSGGHPTSPAPYGCNNLAYLTIDPQGNGTFDEMYSMLLAAYMSDRPVNVISSGCGAINTQHPKIFRMKMTRQ